MASADTYYPDSGILGEHCRYPAFRWLVTQQNDSLVKDLQGEVTQLEHYSTSDISSSSDVLQLENQWANQQASI
jgi:hypothetical protein